MIILYTITILICANDKLTIVNKCSLHSGDNSSLAFNQGNLPSTRKPTYINEFPPNYTYTTCPVQLLIN